MTNEEIELNNNIPDSEIQEDIEITRHEIEQYEAELKILRNNPVENKVQIYFREGKIRMRYDFIQKLLEIINYRNMQKTLKTLNQSNP